jgi:HlyD family secretion protein
MMKVKNTREQGNKVVGKLGAARRILLILIAVAVVAAIAVFGSMRTKGSAAVSKSLSTFTARRDDLTITVTESGSINARNTIDIKCEVEAGRMGGGSGGGGVTILSIVPEGTYVTPEDVNNLVLVELDSSVMEEQIEQYEIDVATAKASLTEADEANRIQVKQNESDITAAELAVKFARMDFQKYLGEALAQGVIEKTGLDPNSGLDVASLLSDANSIGGQASQMLKQYGDEILLAKGQYQKYTDVLEGTQKLYDANYASALDLQSAKLDVQRFEVQTDSATEALRLYRLYDFPKEAEKFLSDYEEAKRELDRTKARARSMLAQTEAKLLSAKARFELQDQRLKKAERQIAACVIKAPAPGLVVYASSSDVFMRRGGGSSRNIDEGETVYERQKIISLPDTAEMIAEIAVHEAEVDKVSAGQRAVITVDPFPDQTFTGQVLKIAQLPDARRGFLNPDLKVYTTQVLIKGTHDFLKPGMSAKVEILVEQLKDVIIVPVQVVANRGGSKVCFVSTSSGPKERVVQTGAFDDTFVQIVEGLKEGEEVLLNPPRVTKPGDQYGASRRPGRFGDAEDQPGETESQSGRPGQGPGAPGGRGPGGGRRPQGGEGPGGGRRQQGEGTPGSGRRAQGGGASGRGGPPQGGQFELTDEIIDRMMSGLAQMDPEKAKELEQLRQSDPEKFKAELRKTMQSMRSRMRQGGNREGRGGNAGRGQNR